MRFGTSQYDWPGNVRELENCMDRMCTMHTVRELTLEHLPTSFTVQRNPPRLTPEGHFASRRIGKSAILAAIQTLMVTN